MSTRRGVTIICVDKIYIFKITIESKLTFPECNQFIKMYDVSIEYIFNDKLNRYKYLIFAIRNEIISFTVTTLFSIKYHYI